MNALDKWKGTGLLDNSRCPEELAQMFENVLSIYSTDENKYSDNITSFIFPVLTKLNNEKELNFDVTEIRQILDDIQSKTFLLEQLSCNGADVEKIAVEIYCENYKK